MKVKIKDGYLVIRIPLTDLPFDGGEPEKPQSHKPQPIHHSAECVGLRASEMKFAVTWPIHCRTCAAKGYYTNGSTGQKVTCPRCLEFGMCPRCGNSALEKVSTEDGTFVVCPGCDWDQRDAFAPAASAAGIIAPVWRCICGREEAANATV